MNKNKQILVEFESSKLELNHLFQDLELIPGCPLDEFEHLSNQLLSHLSKGADLTKTFNIVKSELITRYGLSISDNEAKQIAEEVYEFWINRNE